MSNHKESFVSVCGKHTAGQFSPKYYMQEYHKDSFIKSTTIFMSLSQKGKKVDGECDWNKFSLNLKERWPEGELFDLHYLPSERESIVLERSRVLFFPNQDRKIVMSFEIYDNNVSVEKSFYTDKPFMGIQDVEIFFTSDVSNMTEIMEGVLDCAKDCFIKQKKSASVGLITAGPGGFDLSFQPIEEPVINDLDLYYGEGFKEMVHDKIVANILDGKTGLSLLKGLPGTGKTTYLKYLCAQLGDERDFIYIYPDMAANITTSQMIDFTINECNNAIFIIEDSELLFSSRDTNPANSAIVSSFLNTSDGFMSDMMSAQFICTVNNDTEKMDQALFRKGRMLLQYEFEELSGKDANRLRKELGLALDPKEEDATLAEIFNQDNQVIIPGKKKKVKAIGFRQN